MEAEEHTNNRLMTNEKLLLSGTFLACARGTVVLDSSGHFSTRANRPVDQSTDTEAFKDDFILFSRN